MAGWWAEKIDAKLPIKERNSPLLEWWDLSSNLFISNCAWAIVVDPSMISRGRQVREVGDGIPRGQKGHARHDEFNRDRQWVDDDVKLGKQRRWCT